MIDWATLRQAGDLATATRLVQEATSSDLTPAGAADLIGAARARDLTPPGCGWHDLPVASLRRAWNIRVRDAALLRWESALRARIVADVLTECEAELQRRLEVAGVRSPGRPGSPAARSLLRSALSPTL